MESRASLPKTQTRLGLFIDHSYEFFFFNRRRQYTVYAIVFSVAFTYAIVSDLVFAKPELSVVIESITLAFLLLIALPATYILGSIKGVERTVPDDEVRQIRAVPEPDFDWATPSYLPLADLGNALKTIQSNLANQQQTQDLITRAICSFDSAQRSFPVIVQELAQMIAGIEGNQIREQLRDATISLHEIANLISKLSGQDRQHLVSVFSEVMEKQNDQFAKIVSEVLERQNKQIAEIIDRVAEPAKLRLGNRSLVEGMSDILIRGKRKILLPGEIEIGEAKGLRMVDGVRQLAVGDLLAYKDPEISMHYGTGVVRTVTHNEYSILWSERGLINYQRSILDEKLEQVFQRVDRQAGERDLNFGFDRTIVLGSGFSPGTKVYFYEASKREGEKDIEQRPEREVLQEEER